MLTLAMEAGSGEALLALIALLCVIAAYYAGRAQAAKLSRLTRVVKTNPKLGAGMEYIHMRVIDETGVETDLMFQPWQIRDAKHHANVPEFTD